MIYNLINIIRFLCFVILYLHVCACMTNNNDCDFVSSSVYIILQNKGNWRISDREKEKESLVGINLRFIKVHEDQLHLL